MQETVAIDALAASGVTFKDFHTFPLCTPSRAQLLTGRHGLRTGVTHNFDTGSLFGLPKTEHTIAELLKPAGYDTVQLGKWREHARRAARARRDALRTAECPSPPSHRPGDAPGLPPDVPRL